MCCIDPTDMDNKVSLLQFQGPPMRKIEILHDNSRRPQHDDHEEEEEEEVIFVEL